MDELHRLLNEYEQASRSAEYWRRNGRHGDGMDTAAEIKRRVARAAIVSYFHEVTA